MCISLRSIIAQSTAPGFLQLMRVVRCKTMKSLIPYEILLSALPSAIVLALGFVPLAGIIRGDVEIFEDQLTQVVFFGVPGGITGLLGLFLLGEEVLKQGVSTKPRRYVVLSMVAVGYITAAYVGYHTMFLTPYLLIGLALPAITSTHLLILLRRRGPICI